MEIKFKQGDRITIPEGCKATIDGNEVVIEKEREKFKRGDVITSLKGEILLVNVHDHDSRLLRSFVHIEENKEFYQSPYLLWNESHPWRLATDEEKQLLFDKMKEKGLRWNAEEKRMEKIRWRAEDGEEYYYVGNQGIIMVDKEDGHCADKNRHEFDNYFRTSEQAEKAAEAVKETLRKFHEENDL